MLVTTVKERTERQPSQDAYDNLSDFDLKEENDKRNTIKTTLSQSAFPKRAQKAAGGGFPLPQLVQRLPHLRGILPNRCAGFR
jgi:hypothetical protein